MTWALILTIMSTTPRFTVATLTGFHSAATCRAAGDAWLRQVGSADYYASRALCVRQ